MPYIENPKTQKSGIYSAIPQKGTCPIGCDDCFFQSGRSYLEPLEKNLPNLPDPSTHQFNVIRVNDGNDSNINREIVIENTNIYSMKFFNTSIPKNLQGFINPVVLTVNPHKMTNHDFHKVQHPFPKNLMYVRVRVNTWNLQLVDTIIDYYTKNTDDINIPVILTFMAYYGTADTIPENHTKNYIFRTRTINSYNAITTKAWRKIMKRYEDNKWVHSCGKIEGEIGDTKCRFCGNCLREYFATIERLKT